ncbi:MAG: septum formation protein Maf [Zetaproteobacteria bacterium CG12_big_fil_rev_8_21_14_0_65_54_13]|nr:MAG: septum formation protein Maf [Zetaproteobacteria bacterium CG23_combo_of_CG06-09_8_20_14_all_54_7]PIW44905.1 MAG: septum formation protein Maf [Zetaproteobacteria bacterium CG12_big_fil_rev_8_21_14_0_65_54_13]PIX55957.1 MAG: septum formation protein Maf [Zetaproteobacteria bacterium CG_4_10_14_3_um_filter_54_28]PJA30711.1 MAG: septum formation protein Maf [Zetaproteobacteria bacterium CG_4_9_14_3_um_filter_54_145]
MEVILASQSPRRLTLLQGAGLAVEVRPQHIDETISHGETVSETVSRLSREKALACAAAGDIPIIAADTLVAIHGRAFGQPADLDEARQMLEELSGQTHQVLTGVAVRIGELMLCEQVATSVRFRKLCSTEISTYLAHNEVLDKAGGYAVQGGAASFIEAIDGPLDNVIGLPICTTMRMIEQIKAMEQKR